MSLAASPVLAQAAGVVARQAAATTAAAAAAAATTAIDACSQDNDYDGRIGLRISAIFVILLGSLFGAVFPVYARNNRGVRVPEWAFFIAKYFGSGVIVATAFVHLLSPANDALRNPCLTGPITEYDWVEGICIMTIFVLFFVEIMAMRYSHASHGDSAHSHDLETQKSPPARPFSSRHAHSHGQMLGEDHLGHTREHDDPDSEAHKHSSDSGRPGLAEDYAAQMTAIFILEFGVIFHSIFVGLTLAVAGAEFNTLYVVLVFHQTFEGLGLGSRLAATPWSASHHWTPYIMGVGYAISTPVAMAIGLGVRQTYAPGSSTSLLVNGIFDSISAGILIYTGLVELMAHEFMFSEVMRRAKIRVVLSAYGTMCLGAGLMATLGKWA